MAINAGQVFVELGARLDRREFQQYEKHLKEVREQASKKERYKAQLGADFDNRAFRAYERELKQTQRHTDDTVRANGRLRTSFGQVWSRGGAAFAAAGGAYAVFTAVKSITKAYGEAEVSQRKLQAQLKASGISYDAHAKEIDEVIQKTSQLAGLDDEDLQDAFTNIIRVTGNVDKSLRLVGLAADFARAKHMDVAKAGELVGKVAGGNTGILSRYGIQIDKGASATEALGVLQRKFGGQAEAYGKTQAGAQDRVRVAFENLQEVLGKRFGPTITRYANRLANFINQMSDGEGAGGRFANGLERVAKVAGGAVRLFQGFARAVRVGFAGTLDVLDKAYGAVSTLFTALSKVPGMGWAKNVARDIDTSREKLRAFKKDLDVGVAARDVEQQIARMRRRTHGSLNDILSDTRENMRAIRRRLGSDSKAGKEALENNFDAAVTAIRRAMRRGTVSTRAGLGEIRRLMLQELKTLGISSAQEKGKPLTQDPAAANRAQRYMGGWMGQRGEVGHDTIPALLAPGEAVLNRHQQAVIEGMLGDGFLDRLFSTVNRPHFMARGGRALRRFARGGNGGGRFLQLPEGIHVTHQTAGLSGYPAEDIFASPGTSVGAPVSGTVARLSGQAGGPGGGGPYGYSIYLNGANGRSYFLTHFGSTSVRPGQKVRRGQIIGTVADYPGGVPDHIHEGVHGGLTGLTPGGPSGAGAVAAVWEAIKAPRTTMTGALGDVVQGTLDRTTAAANRRGRQLAASATSGPAGVGPLGGRTSAGGRFNKAQLAALWRRAGGPANVANLMAAVALAESGGNPNAHNPSGATGLWQILGNPFPGNARDPLTNARMAVSKYRSQGLGAWEAYTRGMHKRFMQRGGFARFARGGRAGRGGGLGGYQGGAAAGGGGTKLTLKGLRGIQGDRIDDLEDIEANVEDMRENYSRQDRRYSLSDEILIDETTGAVNEGAVKKRANELLKLLAIRAHILRQLRKMRTILRRVVQTYRTIIRRLTRSLRHAKNKERSGIRKQIAHYRTQLSNRQGQLKDLRGDIFDAETDVMEIRAERKEVLGTTAEVRTPDDIASDLSDAGGDVGGDAGGGEDTTEAPPTPLQLAEGVAAEMRTFLAGRQELLTSFGRNFVPTSQGGATFGTPDALTSAAGLRAFGGAGTAGGLGGATVIAHFASSPENAPTFVEQVRFLVGG